MPPTVRLSLRPGQTVHQNDRKDHKKPYPTIKNTMHTSSMHGLQLADAGLTMMISNFDAAESDALKKIGEYTCKKIFCLDLDSRDPFITTSLIASQRRRLYGLNQDV